MALQITGPTVINFPSGTDTFSADYNTSKSVTWSVTVLSDGPLSPADYSVSIDSNGLLTITLTPGTNIPPGTSLSLRINATTGKPGAGNNGTLGVTVNLPAGVVPCFVAGTLIETEYGPRPVEDLAVGDLVRVASGELLPIVWIGKRTLSAEELKLNSNFRPVCIGKNALGPDLPSRDLFVSPQHRIVLQGWPAEMLFGEPQVFAAAVHLVDDRRIRRVTTDEPVTYFHLACERHVVLIANGLPTESLFPGDMALMAFDRADVNELLELFPDLNSDRAEHPETRLRCLKRGEALVARDIYLQ
ncbi:hypothetical protein FGK63_10820 [Ruegeria sediminis]|uniref:Hedgehog/Intein (Hint) domain-containing protein n=1 Tax=Ruegeria sediminis TaxID=2583820 RepID=A0ABY2WZM9_9RHOB|nr:Hint domain-containing protein [Ruegeria sediminis]TMV07937.1 hypothetical protein FGK63_10820 [Ruegeria sediminis]